MLDNTPNQPSKFRTKNWVEVNNEWRKTYKVNSQIKFRISMLRSNLYDYSDAYIFVATAANPSNRKNIIIKNCASFNNWINKINNTK